MSKKDGELKFEEGLAQLEKLVADLESSELNLDKSLRLFEDGIKLARVLNAKLDQAEKKLEMLIKTDTGELKAEELEFESEESGEE